MQRSAAILKGLDITVLMCDTPCMANILLLNGPNLNLLGQREPSLYGSEHLDEIVERLIDKAAAHAHTLDARQSNAESDLITWIQEANNDYAIIILNAGGLTHTSVSLRDAISAIKTPVIEVHMSNIYQREPFRQHSLLSDVACGIICGFGRQSYDLALDAALKKLS